MSILQQMRDKISHVDYVVVVGAIAIGRSVFSRSLHGMVVATMPVDSERGGDSFDDPAKIDRGVAV